MRKWTGIERLQKDMKKWTDNEKEFNQKEFTLIGIACKELIPVGNLTKLHWKGQIGQVAHLIFWF